MQKAVTGSVYSVEVDSVALKRSIATVTDLVTYTDIEIDTPVIIIDGYGQGPTRVEGTKARIGTRITARQTKDDVMETECRQEKQTESAVTGQSGSETVTRPPVSYLYLLIIIVAVVYINRKLN